MQFTNGVEPTVSMRVYAKTYEEVKKVAYDQHVSLPEALHRMLTLTYKEGAEAERIKKLEKEIEIRKSYEEKLNEMVEQMSKTVEQMSEMYKSDMEKTVKEVLDDMSKKCEELIDKAYNIGLKKSK